MLSQRLTAVADRLVARAPTVGPTAAVICVASRSGELIRIARGHEQTYVQDTALPSPPPAGPDTVFDVGSVTKVAVTTCLVLDLCDRGMIGLEEPVQRYLPRFAGEQKNRVTIRDLLEHRAGLRAWWPAYAAGAREPGEALEIVQTLPLVRPAGVTYCYSDLSFMLLGALVSRVCDDQPLNRLAQARVCGPVGMTRSGFRPPAIAGGVADRIAATSHGDAWERRMVATGRPWPVPYDPDSFDGWRWHTLLGEVNDGNAWHAFGGIAGHAGMFTTAPDLSRLGQALLTSLAGTGPWRAETAVLFLRPGRDPRQALGFRVQQLSPGLRAAWHPGFPGARFAVLPETEHVVVLLTNRLHTRRGDPPSIDDAWTAVMTAVTDNLPGGAG